MGVTSLPQPLSLPSKNNWKTLKYYPNIKINMKCAEISSLAYPQILKSTHLAPTWVSPKLSLFDRKNIMWSIHSHCSCRQVFWLARSSDIKESRTQCENRRQQGLPPYHPQSSHGGMSQICPQEKLFRLAQGLNTAFSSELVSHLRWTLSSVDSITPTLNVWL